MAVLNLIIDNAPTKPNESANEDLTIEIIKFSLKGVFVFFKLV